MDAPNIDNVIASSPAFEGREVIIKKSNHTSNQIVQEVLEAHAVFADHYDMIVRETRWKRGAALEKQLFEFCKYNLHYVEEKGFYQSTRSPAGILELGSIKGVGVDCKHFAGFIAGVLSATNRKEGKRVYDWYYRFASYDSNREPGHVFVIVKKDDGDDVWIDPVLIFFDQRFPRPIYYKDKTVNMPLVRISGAGAPNPKTRLPVQYWGGNPKKIGCGCDGDKMGTVSSTGATLMKVAPLLSEVPVAALAVEAVGLCLEVFGSKYPSSLNTNKRWVVQLYQYYVLGQGNVTSDNDVNAGYGPAAFAWFAQVMGVSIPDNVTFNLLKGYVNNKPSNQTYEQRATNYLANKWVSGDNIPFAQAVQAAQIADTLPYYPQTPGAWAGAVSAPTLIVPAGVTDQSGTYSVVGTTGIAPAAAAGASNPLQSAWAWAQANPLPAVGITIGVIGIGYLLFKKK